MFAAIAALFATSCVTDTTSDVVVTGGECDVTLSVVAPGADSRATIGTGLKATDLTCVVYDHEWKYLTTKTTTFDNGSLSTTIEMRLVKGKEYNFVFWAQAPEATCYTLNFGTTVGEVVAPNVVVNYNTDVTANDDHRDAFFGNWNCTVTGTINHTVELYRPFAQINFGTNDHLEAEEFGFDVVGNTAATTTVTTRAYNTLYLATGVVENEQDVTFAAAALPVDTTLETKNGDYHWLAMNYILWPAYEASLSTCTMTVAASGHSVTVEVPGAPARRNWRTNLVGKILTEQGNLTIEIKPMPEGELPDENNILHQLTVAAYNGGEVTLTEDVVTPYTLVVSSDMTLDLGGKSLAIDSTTRSAQTSDPVIQVQKGAKLIVKNGTIKSEVVNGGATIYNEGTVVLMDGANIVGAPIGEEGYPSYCIRNAGNLTIEEGVTVSADRGCLYLSGTGETVINGGTLSNNDIGDRSFTSHVIVIGYGANNKLTINDGTFQHLHTKTSGGVVVNNWSAVTVDINGGDFRGGNYFGKWDNLTDYGYGSTSTPFCVKGGSFSGFDNKFLAEGYKAIPNAEQTLWVVAPAVAELENTVVHEESGLIYNGNDALGKGVYYILNAGDLKKAVDYFVNKTHEGNTVTFELMADIDMSGIAWEPWTIMWINFKGNNHTISNLTTVEGWRGGLFGYFGAGKVENLTIENATVVGAQAGILVGAAEAVVATNVKIAGVNSVTYKQYVSASYTETWGGIGAVSGVNTGSTLDVEVVAGAVVDVNTNGMVTEAPFVDALTGHIQPNKGRVVVNGTVNYNVDSKIVANSTGTTYYGDHFAGKDSMSDALVINGANLTGDATIEVKRKYNAIVIENVKGDLNGDFITIDNEDNSVMILQNCDLTLAEGKKFIKSTKTIYQVFMANITINGVKLTNENAGQYLENVGWFQIVEEI